MLHRLRQTFLAGAALLAGVVPFALLGSAVVAGTTALVAARPAGAATACPTYFFYGVRGSNETPGTPLATSNPGDVNPPMAVNGLGSPIGATYAALQAALPNVSIFAEADGYPALLQPSAVLTLGATYEASMNAGVDDAVADINAEHALCPQAKIIAAGYSQGADALRRALNPGVSYPVGSVTPYPTLNFTPTAGQVFLLLFGDPNFHNETGPIFTGGGTTAYTGVGIAATALGLEPATPAIASVWHTESFCHWGDIVCQFSLGSGTSAHLDYNLDGTSGAWRIIQFFGLQSSTVSPATARMRSVSCTSPGSNQANVTLTNTNSTTGASVTFTSSFLDDFGNIQSTTPTVVAPGASVQLALHLPNVFTSSLQIDSTTPSAPTPVPLETQLLIPVC
jgi:hypothetical protein